MDIVESELLRREKKLRLGCDVMYERIMRGEKDNKERVEENQLKEDRQLRKATNSRKKPELNLANDC